MRLGVAAGAVFVAVTLTGCQGQPAPAPTAAPAAGTQAPASAPGTAASTSAPASPSPAASTTFGVDVGPGAYLADAMHTCQVLTLTAAQQVDANVEAGDPDVDDTNACVYSHGRDEYVSFTNVTRSNGQIAISQRDYFDQARVKARKYLPSGGSFANVAGVGDEAYATAVLLPGLPGSLGVALNWMVGGNVYVVQYAGPAASAGPVEQRLAALARTLTTGTAAAS